jgi:hypothetical protein
VNSAGADETDIEGDFTIAAQDRPPGLNAGIQAPDVLHFTKFRFPNLFRNHPSRTGFLKGRGRGASNRRLKGECKMSMPNSIAAWCTVLFFLVYGINAFVAIPAAAIILGLLALGVAVFTFLGK